MTEKRGAKRPVFFTEYKYSSLVYAKSAPDVLGS
jgi:hypothetical protein